MAKPDRVVDLRSDTVTRPGPEMRKAIAAAEVGDDVLEKDPTVGALEERVAGLLGKEAALFVPSGTMANQISVRGHCPPGSEVILERGSHVLNFESGAAHVNSGVGFYAIDGDRGLLDPDAVRRSIRPPVVHVPQTALVWAENTHNAAGGSVWPLEQLDAVAAVAHEAGLPFHLDGARIWNAAVASGETPARIAEGADTVSVCMSKGLGAPVGSLVAGRADFIGKAWVIRKQLGGGMRQSGVLAAGALYGLDHHVSRLAEDHVNARLLAERLAELPGVTVDLDATQTNIVVFDVAATGRDPQEIAAQAEQQGVRIVPFGRTLLRAVTHLDVTQDDVIQAADVLADVLASDPRALPPVERGIPMTTRTLASPPVAGLHPVVVAVWAKRVGSEEAAVRFLEASPASIPAPSVLPGMEEAADRVGAALETGETIGVFGHDDADGITSAVLMTEVLRALGAEVVPYVPDRAVEGHGLYPDLVRRFRKRGVALLVTTDGCSSNRRETDLAKSLGMDVLVTDHHEVAPGRPVPPLLLNPKAHAETRPRGSHLTGAGVAALLAREVLARREQPPEEFERLLDLVALGTIADRADLGGGNRAMVVQGLHRVRRGDRPAIEAARRAVGLGDAALQRPEECRRLAAVFASVPSRNGESPGFDALLGGASWEADVSAIVAAFRRSEDENRDATERALRLARDAGMLDGEPAVVELEGVPLRSLGVAATRLVETTDRPAAVFTNDGGKLVCELRGPAGVHLVDLLGGMRELLESWGGHRTAAGFSAEPTRAAEIRERLAAAFRKHGPRPPVLPTPEGDLAPEDLDARFVRSVVAAAPFGRGNPAPVLRLRGFRGGEAGPELEGFPARADGRDPLVTLRPNGKRGLIACFEGWVE